MTLRMMKMKMMKISQAFLEYPAINPAGKLLNSVTFAPCLR